MEPAPSVDGPRGRLDVLDQDWGSLGAAAAEPWAAAQPRTLPTAPCRHPLPEEEGPLTPPSTGCGLAAVTPGATPSLTAQLAAGPGGGPTAARGAPPTPGGAAAALQLRHRAESFVSAVLGSPLVQSALLALEVDGSHPAADSTAGGQEGGAQHLLCTLGQMLALHLRAGYEAASEVQLLASLWTLEAWGDVRRTRCSEVLYSYLRNLDLYDQQRAHGMAKEWERAFRCLQAAMARSQLDLLKRVGWAVRLDSQLDVAPCMGLLRGAAQRPLVPSAMPHAVEVEHLDWAAGGITWAPSSRSLGLLCTRIQRHAEALSAAAAAAARAGGSAAKRARRS